MLQHYFDRIAVALSGICAIHCIALPVVAGVAPFLAVAMEHGDSLHQFWFHQFILIFILPTSVIALVVGHRCHKRVTPVLIGGIGLIILVFIGIFAGDLLAHHIIPHEAETWIVLIGGAIHAVGHIANMLATKRLRAQAACSTE